VIYFPVSHHNERVSTMPVLPNTNFIKDIFAALKLSAGSNFLILMALTMVEAMLSKSLSTGELDHVLEKYVKEDDAAE